MTRLNSPQPFAEPEPKKRISPLRLILWLLVLLFLCAYYPPFFRFGVIKLAEFAAKRSGLHIEIARVNGSLFEPVSIYNATLSSDSFAGSEIHLRITRAEAQFSFGNLLLHRGKGCLSKLVIDGMDCEIILNPEARAGSDTSAYRPIPWRLVPSSIEVRRVNLAVHEKDNLVFFQNIECKASDVKPGRIRIEKIHVAESWLTKTFFDVYGTMALQNSRISVATLTLEKGIRLESASADLMELLHRRLKMDFHFSAFGGDIRGDVLGFTREQEQLNFEATGSFSSISIPGVAAFLKSHEVTGGTIQDGKFAFHGSLHNLRKARFSTRFVAGDFRWGERQWNSLVLGAVMVDGHFQIPNLELRQAHNTLNLSGEIAIPDSPGDWLNSDFNFNIDARIDNATELSLLFGPDFADTAGTASVKGSIRGHDMSFTGDLAVSGSNLTYKTVPIDNLHASVNLNGDELEITSLELAHKNDFLRGTGGTDLSRERKYWGELNASIEDLTTYSAILQPAIFRQFYGGGLVIQWSGDGTAKAHSGAFHAQLKNIHPLEQTEPKSIPLNADLEGTYSPESIFFKKFAVSNTFSSLVAVITANPESITLDALQLKQGNEVCLEGNALLPFNLWKAWNNPASVCWNSAGECKLDLTARKLNLHNALTLSGREFPMRGEIQGKLATSGTFTSLDATGEIHFSKGQLDLTPGLAVFEAAATLAGKKLTLEKSLCRLNSTDFTADGEIDFNDYNNPVLKLSTHSKAEPFEPTAYLKAKTDLNLNLDGPFASVRVTGTALIQEVEISTRVDLFSLVLGDNRRLFDFEPGFRITQTPYDKWQIDLICTSNGPLKTGKFPGTVRPDLRIRGSGVNFTTSGSLCFENMPFAGPSGTVTINEATVFLQPDHPENPHLAARFSGTVPGREIYGYALGEYSDPEFILVSNPPLPEPLIHQLLARGFTARFRDGVLPVFLDGIPFELQSPFLDSGGKPAGLLPISSDEGADFTFYSTSNNTENPEAAPADQAK